MPVAIDKPSKYFNTVTWTGTGSSLSITGVGFKPDWVWYKGRSFAYNHGLFDAVRGTTKFLSSNQTIAETTFSGVTAFNSDGFTLGTDAGGNNSGTTYVGWNWLGANTTVSNTSGTITSTVSANTTSGFSIVSYTGNGTNGATIGHGLGVAPKMIITKQRNSAGNWFVYHNKLPVTEYIILNSDVASQTDNEIIYYDTTPSSTTFTVGNYSQINGSANTFVSYCFAEVKGFSKFGSYTGNGSTDGTFVYTGFKPAFVMIKSSSNITHWSIVDSVRAPFNEANKVLYPDLSNAEVALYDFRDYLSNGFKLRSSDSQINASGQTFIYMAFADSPFVSSKAIPTTAR